MASFQFTKEPPPENMYTDMQMLNKLNENQFQGLSNVVFTYLQDPNAGSRLLTQLEEFSQDHGLGLATVRNLVRSLISVTNGALKANLGADALKEDLVKLGLSSEKSTHVSEKYATNLVSLSKAALSQTLMVNQLVDMEWKFGVTAASSETSKVANSFLQLKLVINKGNKMENVYMELSLPQFYSFLHEMEKAKSSLEFLA